MNLLFSILVGLGVIVLWAVYVLLAALGKGYYGLEAPFGAVGALSFIPYPDMSKSFLFDFSSIDSVYRVVSIGIVLLVAVLGGLLFHHFFYKKVNGEYKAKFIQLLIEEGKINGLIFDKFEDNQKESFLDTVHLLNMSSGEYQSALQFTTGALSWIGRQYTYLRDNKPRDAYIISTDLTKARSHAFIQLRTFGEPSIKQYGGLPIHKYGFGDENGIEDFICFTTLGQDIYLTIDKKAAKAVSDLHQFVKSDLVIMVIGDKLTVMIDGFRLRLSQELNKSVPNQILEQEAEALSALHQSVTTLSMAFSGDIAFGEEEKGNGITSY